MNAILLAGVALAGLPVILHLIMKQEPKRLPFPALRFLKLKNKTNQRKMRLRHLLLLSMRVLLILLFALTLFQPTLKSDGMLPLAGEQPVAAVFVIDTSPSMGYVAGEKSRLEEARGRALTLLDDLPPNSRVAVLDPVDPVPAWEQSIADARKKIEGLKEPHGGGPPITTALATAYRLLQTANADADRSAILPGLVAAFSDRTVACWDPSRAEDLVKLRDAVPRPPGADASRPAVAGLFVDVGVDQPVDVAVLSATVTPQLIPAGQPVTVVVTVQATGTDVPSAAVRCRVDGSSSPERKEVRCPAGTPQSVSFTLRDLKPGLHQAEISLEAPDPLLYDNVRYLTFRIGEARKLLTICDEPDDAAFWKLAHETKGEFACDVKTLAEATDFSGYEAVCLLNVADPGKPLWTRLAEYAARGGKVLVMPGPGPQIAAAYNSTEAGELLPGKLAKILEDPKGAVWRLDDAALRHPLMAPFREWKLAGTVDFLKSPRRAWKFWEVEAKPDAVVVTYDDAAPEKRFPAMLERRFPGDGKVVMLTTRMDPQWSTPGNPPWNNYWQTGESSWGVVFPNLLARYLCGTAADGNFNFATGQAVSVALPKGAGRKLILEGPGVSGRDATPDVGDKDVDWKLSPLRSLTAGNYQLRTPDRTWVDGFSLNAAAEECDLAKVPPAAIEAVFGPNSIVPAGKGIDFRESLDTKFDQPIDLYPWLLIAVLVLFVLEGAFANRFYRTRTETKV